MRFRDQLKDDLMRLPEIEKAIKESARHILLVKTLADADPAAPKGVREGLEENLEEHRRQLADIREIRRQLPEKYLVGSGGDA